MNRAGLAERRCVTRIGAVELVLRRIQHGGHEAHEAGSFNQSKNLRVVRALGGKKLIRISLAINLNARRTLDLYLTPPFEAGTI